MNFVYILHFFTSIASFGHTWAQIPQPSHNNGLILTEPSFSIKIAGQVKFFTQIKHLMHSSCLTVYLILIPFFLFSVSAILAQVCLAIITATPVSYTHLRAHE